MKLTVTSEFHCVADNDGIWSVDRGTYAYYTRFLDVFEEVSVFCRVKTGTRSGLMQKVTGDGVTVSAVPDFYDPRSFLRVARQAHTVARRAASEEGAFLLHAPGTTASLLGFALQRQRRGFSIEVVGDPRKSLAGSSVLSKTIAFLTAQQMSRLSKRAKASRYVTENALQELYPPAAGSATFVFSDVEIPDSVFLEPIPPARPGPVLDLGFVGMLHMPYKGLDVLLDALSRTEHPHRLKVLGDGSLRGELTAWASAHGLADRVMFLGTVPMGEQVRAFLGSRDMVVAPSRTEGMPRALIEAMAVGIPCLATPVGGVPDLLGSDALVPCEDSVALALAIDAFATSPTVRAAHSQRNRIRSKRYARSCVDEVSKAFHEAIRDNL